MEEQEYADLHTKYGGRFVARADGRVVADAATYGELEDELKARAVDRSQVVVEFVDRPDRTYVR